ncbi:Protein glass [Melipona quadrifasciata]|uniref:Protein glass n=1 Tax=Melipona quadrifasciata TaxID=166423 RepID=A0A0M9A0K5_9HYME|nr:Protein glass [Melipona quadrifasciata]
MIEGDEGDAERGKGRTEIERSYARSSREFTTMRRDGLYECPSCHNLYKWKKSMLSHLRNQCKQPPRFECPHCTMKNYQKSHMIRHLRINASDKKKPFQCQKCGRGFTLKRNKDRHVNYECGHEPRFQCPYCGLRSKQTSPVYAHIRKKHPEEEVFIFDMKL